LPGPIVACAANFSEGRDPAIVDSIAEAIAAVPRVAVLHRTSDPDHHRSVITFAGPTEAVAAAALRAVAKAVERIDLNRHTGAHPRIGAADVIPFVPVAGIHLDDCVRLAHRVGEEIWNRLHVPVYFYEAAALRPERTALENVRRGGFEGLREAVQADPDRYPDLGEAALHPTAGAVAVGARRPLIAFNIQLRTADVAIAQAIARAIRHSSGGYRHVKALGLALPSRGLVQVSCNFTDFERTPLHRVFETVRSEAQRYGVEIAGSELIGLIPGQALALTADHYLRMETPLWDFVLENRLARAQARDGLGDYLDEMPDRAGILCAAAALAASMGCKVAGEAKLSDGDFRADREFFASHAHHGAADTLSRAMVLRARLAALRQQVPRDYDADLVTALELVETAIRVK
jgi:glutamate formiminotransferase